MKIIKQPDPVLTKKAKPVERVDAKVKKLVNDMFETLAGQDAVGLAAPQVGESISLAIIGFTPTQEQLKENPDLETVPKAVFINPRLCFFSKDRNIGKEGCLSVPHKVIAIARYTKVHVEFLDKNGKKTKLKARGYLARVIQHEIDHLEGKLITDYQK